MKNFIKKILAVLTILFVTTVLNGCGDETPEATLQAYDGGFFTIDLPSFWQVITKSEFYSEIPDEAVIAFSDPESTDGFYINVNIIEEKMNLDVPSIDFGRANINLAGKNLTDYVKIQDEEIDLNGTPALVHIFTARLNPTEKEIRFIQLYTTKNKTGYTVTGAMPIDTLEEKRNETGAIVTSFRLK